MRRAAFTLIELLVASAISAVLMTAVAIAISAGMRSAARVTTHTRGAIAEAAFIRALQSDIASAAPLNNISFTGAERAMSFSRLASPNAAANNIQTARINWQILPARGAIRTVTFANGATHTETFALKNPPTFSYAGDLGGNAEVKSQTATAPQFADDWNAPAYPALVRAGATTFTVWMSNYSMQEPQK